MVLIFGRNIKEASRWLAERSGKYVSSFLVLFGILLAVLFLASFVMKYEFNVSVVYIDVDKPITHVTSEKFLSIALDSAVIANGLKHFDVRDPKLMKVMKPLAPGYLRIGGNLADRLYFVPDGKFRSKYSTGTLDGGDCSYASYYCELFFLHNFTMSGKEWLKLHKMISSAGFEIIFDLNVLTRFKNGSWNSENARELIDFSDKHGLFLHWELGNEPDAFRHQFGTYISPQALADDFKKLRGILDEYPRYRWSLLLGPDVTRPQENRKESLRYLAQFLVESGEVVDVVTWHQYYFNGRFARPFFYINPKVFDMLKPQIEAVNNLTEALCLNKSVWLGETADAWGGGAEDLSNAFISTFIWLDKLGMAAQMGIDVVIRQSIVEGYYALLTDEYTPTPNWWASVLYKMLVGPQVVTCYVAAPAEVRLYCQCAKSAGPAVVVFGMNVDEGPANIRIQTDDGILSTRAEAYILTSYLTLFTGNVRLNGEPLKLTDDDELPPLISKMVPTKPQVALPPYSVVFLKIPLKSGKSPCDNL